MKLPSFVKQKSTVRKANQYDFALAVSGGKRDGDEQPLDTAVRECHEEIFDPMGIDIERVRQLVVRPSTTKAKNNAWLAAERAIENGEVPNPKSFIVPTYVVLLNDQGQDPAEFLEWPKLYARGAKEVDEFRALFWVPFRLLFAGVDVPLTLNQFAAPQGSVDDPTPFFADVVVKNQNWPLPAECLDEMVKHGLVEGGAGLNVASYVARSLILLYPVIFGGA